MTSHTSAPLYSIGASKRGSANDPGPGAYELENRKHSTPAWRIGTGKRSNSYRSITPGPGAYNQSMKDLHKAPEYVFGSRSNSAAFIGLSATPGPGAYNNETVWTDSMSYRTDKGEFDKQRENPGPGAYEQSSRILNRSMPSFRIGNSQRENYLGGKDTPGPGSYKLRPDNSYGAYSGPKFPFGTSKRDGIISGSNLAPGPGSYEHTKAFKKSEYQLIKILPKRESTSQNDHQPGPGAYDPNDVHNSIKAKSTTVRIGSAPRGSLLGNKWTPGPGTYVPKHIPSKTAPAYKLGTAQRTSLTERSITPGPGNYYKDEGPVGSKWSIPGRGDDSSQMINSRSMPGPGSYQPSLKMTHKVEPSLSIGHEKRNALYKYGEAPGPGYYELRTQAAGPKWKIGTEMRRSMEKLNNEPGPGAYNIPSLISNAPSYAMIEPQ